MTFPNDINVEFTISYTFQRTRQLLYEMMRAYGFSGNVTMDSGLHSLKVRMSVRKEGRNLVGNFLELMENLVTGYESERSSNLGMRDSGTITSTRLMDLDEAAWKRAVDSLKLTEMLVNLITETRK